MHGQTQIKLCSNFHFRLAFSSLL